MVVFGDENIVLLKEVLSPYCDYYMFSGRLLKNIDLLNQECELLFTRSQTKIDEELLYGTNVKLVATATSGTDHIDKDYLKSVNIPFYDSKGCNANSVAEYVIYALLKWSLKKNIELDKTSIGIIGFGCIGKIVASYCCQLGLKIYVNDPPLKDSQFLFPDYVQYAELDYLIENVQILTNHVPFCSEGKHPTFQLLNSYNLIKFRDNGLIIHTSRGNVIDEKVLHYLHDFKKAELVIDVWNNEPDFDVNLADKCLLSTPHIAGYSQNGKLNGTAVLIDLFEKYYNITVDKSLVINELNKIQPCLVNDFISNKSLFEHLSKFRKIDEDSNKFKELFMLNGKNKTYEFDKLRKNYPVRYESLRPIS